MAKDHLVANLRTSISDVGDYITNAIGSAEGYAGDEDWPELRSDWAAVIGDLRQAQQKLNSMLRAADSVLGKSAPGAHSVYR